MNPSSSGWIDKTVVFLETENASHPVDVAALYRLFRSIGFVYGVHINMVKSLKTSHTLTEEELAKVNLFLAFYEVYWLETGRADGNSFIESALSFYREQNLLQPSFFGKLFSSKKKSHQLERLIHIRVQPDGNRFTRTFSALVTNSLLFIDVLAYRAFISGAEGRIPAYIASLERRVISTAYEALSAKAVKTNYHRRLLKLFEASLRYQEKENVATHDNKEREENVIHPLEKFYLLDVAAMAVWEDGVLDSAEMGFLKKLADDMHLSFAAVEEAVAQVYSFYEWHKDKLPHLQDSYGIKHFYDHSYKMVSYLIIRNKKRLQQEFLESKELVVLLSKSTSRKLSKEEKQKVKRQLVDIFKAIPSLAIFALPGGGVLLPLFIKLIPKLLPSSFDENKVEKLD